ncbi:MAG: thioesterase family protein [Bacteroidota bacterium]|nr:thioesterase family protein [Bacteroidota bacterium]
MARIKLSFPLSFSFFTLLPIRITDLNYGNHVGNDAILSLLHEARMQYLKSFGYTELQFEGIGLIMRDVAIEFKAEVFYGEVVKAYVTTDDITKVGFDIYYKLVKDDAETVVAIAKTGMVGFNYNTRKVVSVPTEAVMKMKR